MIIVGATFMVAQRCIVVIQLSWAPTRGAPTKCMKITKLLQQTECSRLDAEVLLAHVLQKDRSYLRAHDSDELNPCQQEKFQTLVQQRNQGIPLAYLIGHKEFWSLELLVTPDVLIPRPETELLVETVLEILPKNQQITVADLGTGSGAIALALAKERPQWEITAVDFSAKALEIAKKNAQQLNIMNINFIQSDWCTELPRKKYAAIISNPPYIANDDPHLLALRYEPQSALIAEANGLAAFSSIMQQAKSHLKKQGLLLFEHGYNQEKSIKELFEKYSYTAIANKRDLAGLPRVSYGFNLGTES